MEGLQISLVIIAGFRAGRSAPRIVAMQDIGSQGTGFLIRQVIKGSQEAQVAVLLFAERCGEIHEGRTAG